MKIFECSKYIGYFLFYKAKKYHYRIYWHDSDKTKKSHVFFVKNMTFYNVTEKTIFENLNTLTP